MAQNSIGFLLSRLLNRPLLATPEMARFYAAYLATRCNLDGVIVDAELAETPLRAAAAAGRYMTNEWGQIVPATAAQGIATIQITGSLTHRLRSMSPVSGMTGYDAIGVRLDAALADPQIKGILLDIHSYGGEVAGCFDLADRIYAARAVKPVWAVADESAYSAAYALASQADRITTNRTGGVGSVGVVIMHADYAKNLEKEGIKITMIHAGAHKVDGNPFQPLPDDVRAELQSEVEETYALFTALVARGDGIPEAAVVATEARCYDAKDALDIGFVDAIQTADDTFAEFAAQLNAARSFFTAASPANRKGARHGKSKQCRERARARGRSGRR